MWRRQSSSNYEKTYSDNRHSSDSGPGHVFIGNEEDDTGSFTDLLEDVGYYLEAVDCIYGQSTVT